MPESGQKGRTVNSLASAYVGSNPTSPTIFNPYALAITLPKQMVYHSGTQDQDSKHNETRKIWIDAAAAKQILRVPRHRSDVILFMRI